jgi:hypothetical protein
MPRFRTQDLLVSLTPRIAAEEAQRCILHTTICIRPTNWCRYPTEFPCVAHTSLACCHNFTFPCPNFSIPRGGCGVFGSCGGPGGSACDTTYVCPGSWWEIENIEDLVTVKDELKQVLTRLDEIEHKGLPSQFDSLADAQAAEAALTQALEQVRAQKKGLK